MKKLYFIFSLCCLISAPAVSATVIASVNGKPITDTDITARTKLMNRQGQVSTDNRKQALQNIIDDNVKLSYANNFGAVPDDETVNKELKKMNLGDDLSDSEKAMAQNAVKADIAWQIIIGRTIMPTIDITSEDIEKERSSLAKEHGSPIEMTIVRLTDIPADIASKLTKPSSCDEAVKMAENLGGVPQKFTALQYELSEDIRERVADLPKLTWSSLQDDSVLLVCATNKTDEYKQVDDIIKQNAKFKQAMSKAEQQLKQLRRKAVIIINDDRYQL